MSFYAAGQGGKALDYLRKSGMIAGVSPVSPRKRGLGGMIAGIPGRLGNAAVDIALFSGLGMGMDVFSRFMNPGASVDGNDAYYQALQHQQRQSSYSQPPMGW